MNPRWPLVRLSDSCTSSEHLISQCVCMRELEHIKLAAALRRASDKGVGAAPDKGGTCPDTDQSKAHAHKLGGAPQNNDLPDARC